MGSSRSRINKGVITPKIVLIGMASVVILLIIALTASIFFTLQNNTESEKILVDSVKSELIASCVGAREIISENIDLFNAINSQEDVEENWDEWVAVVEELRELSSVIDGEYIYALKELDGQYYFVFDTDEEAQEQHDNFTPYELAPVHAAAFSGMASADIMNVVDEWGSYNTGALPLYDEDDNQIGIVCTDITDTFIERNRATSTFYATGLIVVAGASVVMMLIILFMLIRSTTKTQEHLFELANYDPISGLPNRNNLFTFLAKEIPHLKQHNHPFAVYFVDLDNFKSVNDNAGHDTGDELLREIALFLRAFAEQSPYANSQDMDAITARIGGDEFIQLIPDIATHAEASYYAQSMLEAFGKRPTLQRFIKDFGVGLSIGVSLFPSMQTDYDELIKYADIAMYHAKDAGKNGFRIYDTSMGDDVEGAELIVRTNKSGR